LWTKNFTIITVGSIISMLGNMVAGFAIGLLVLEKTNSTFLYAFFMVVYNLPKIVTPLIAGPFVDRFPRKKIIYTLDFMSTAIYFAIFALLQLDMFSYSLLLVLSLVIGCIDGVYSVAYESFYPNLISDGNFRKAYSISSMIYPLASFMTPVAAVVYNIFGTLAPLFLFNAITFLLAAVCETRIDFDEKPSIAQNQSKGTTIKKYIEDFKGGIAYLKGEKGLMVMTAYFFVAMMAGGVGQTITLPFFKNNPQLFSNIPIDVVTLYTILTTFGVFGRLMGGMIHYKFKYPTNKKFAIALTVYFTICVLEMWQLYLPVPLMAASFFMGGILGVTSYNIRISATQSYVPDEVRGRFNGVFQMINTLGGMFGQLIAGVFGEIMPERTVIAGMMVINIIAVYCIMYKGREHVKKLYNREV
ncbi:MAG: MFS transporter, partial [Oscillospiraceae bacterium]